MPTAKSRSRARARGARHDPAGVIGPVKESVAARGLAAVDYVRLLIERVAIASATPGSRCRAGLGRSPASSVDHRVLRSSPTRPPPHPLNRRATGARRDPALVSLAEAGLGLDAAVLIAASPGAPADVLCVRPSVRSHAHDLVPSGRSRPLASSRSPRRRPALRPPLDPMLR